MSLRRQIRDDIITAAQTLLPDVPVRKWSGEERAFNEEREWPVVYVAYAGVEFSDDMELGAATYERIHYYDIFVCARDDATQTGDDYAMDILETLETGLSGKVVADGRAMLELAEGEALVRAEIGRFLYVQSWRASVLETHES